MDIAKRAKTLDQMRTKCIAEKLTLEEAQNIVSIWGIHLEHAGGLGFLFGTSSPESLLPYPKEILQGAIIKMKAYYHDRGFDDRVHVLDEAEVMLTLYTDDVEAIQKSLLNFSNVKWQEAMIPAIRNFQRIQAENGFLLDKKLWKLTKSRMDELGK